MFNEKKYTYNKKQIYTFTILIFSNPICDLFKNAILETEHAIVEASEDAKEGLRTDETIRMMEKKALNFLVNGYLLQINNKLTAVTFSEENEDQVVILLFTVHFSLALGKQV
ncbi:hypothetical protein DPMN_175643 [Dreissena polymorpha]|uniref:Uncharacterized protein n=1 Tax=Dreissena polymorpha TaxID=45954 RepID=A0A9D4E5K9_DREPO|nr:hypothetical protein DPMN_175643 [Dreissena polymorpha]